MLQLIFNPGFAVSSKDHMKAIQVTAGSDTFESMQIGIANNIYESVNKIIKEMVVEANTEKKKENTFDLNKYQEYTIDQLIKNRSSEL